MFLNELGRLGYLVLLSEKWKTQNEIQVFQIWSRHD